MKIFYVATRWQLECLVPYFQVCNKAILIVFAKGEIEYNNKNSKHKVYYLNESIKQPILYLKRLGALVKRIKKYKKFDLVSFVDKNSSIQIIHSLSNRGRYILIEEGVGLYNNERSKNKIKNRMLSFFERALFALYWQKLIHKTYKEQGKILAGNVLLCRYPKMIGKKTLSKFESIIRFECFFRAEYFLNVNEDVYYFVGSDYNALNCFFAEKIAYENCCQFFSSFNKKVVYLIHPRTAYDSVCEFVKNKSSISSMKKIEGDKTRSTFITYCSGGVMDMLDKGHDVFVVEQAVSERAPYSSFFSQWIALYSIGGTDKKKGVLIRLQKKRARETLKEVMLQHV